MANPAARVKITRTPGRDAQALDAKTIVALSREVPERYQALIVLLGFGGLRLGEALGLRVRDLALDQRRLTIEHVHKENRGKVTYGLPKTGKKRSLHFGETIAEVLRTHLDEYKISDLDDLVFTNQNRTIIRGNAFRKRVWYPACERLKLDPPPHVHDLRHSAISIAIAQGAHPKVIMDMAGHSSITMTLDRYGHLFESLAVSSADDMDEVFRQARDS